jgi:putative molybdopterin biosynthesis protein
MDPLRRIQNFDYLKILADSHRLAILRLLMAKAMTLSQIGQIVGEHPAQVRHHLKQLEKAGLVEMVDTRVVRGFVEKYYRARARAFLIQELILPAHPGHGSIAILGSHDLALEALARHLAERERNPLELLVLPVGSLDGLIALRQGAAQIAGCHLLDAESGEYNLPFIRHLFPDRPVVLITLAHRRQGLIVAEGNPKGIRGLDDLARPDVVLVNRNRGSGTRLWLDRQLQRHSIPASALQGYSREVRTHTAVAEAISQGKADTGLGLLAAAKLSGLDFIDLFEERFDLALQVEGAEDPLLGPFLDFLQSSPFRSLVASLQGYNPAHSGELLNS